MNLSLYTLNNKINDLQNIVNIGNAQTLNGKKDTDFALASHNHNPLTIKLSNTINDMVYRGNENISIGATEFKTFNSENDLRTSTFQGYFKINDNNITGISIKAKNTDDNISINQVNYENYIRIIGENTANCFDKNRTIEIWTDIFNKTLNTWNHSKNYLALKNHTHTKNQITDFPISLPANGGNADMVDNKHASDLQNYNNLTNKPTSMKNPYSLTMSLNGTSQVNYDGSSSKNINITPSNIGAATSNHTHIKSQITNFPTALPANGGNADTVDGKHASDLQNYNNLINKPTSMKNPNSLKINMSGISGEVFYDGSSNIDIKVTQYKLFDTVNELRKSTYEGYFRIGKKLGNYLSTEHTGFSMKTNHTNDEAPDNPKSFANYVRIVTKTYWYSDSDCKLSIWTDTVSESGIWSHSSKDFSMDDHTHSYNSLTNTPKALPANGGNADTIDGKHANELQNYNNLTNKPTSLPANGGNANTLNKINKIFVASPGWYRLAYSQDNASGGIFVLTVWVGTGSSTTVFSASQQYSNIENNNIKIKYLTHASFNNCVTKLRLLNRYGSNYLQYIDFYVEKAANNASLEVQFFGKGWEICDSINSCNTVDEGYTETAITLN